jgi:antirestriction protein
MRVDTAEEWALKKAKMELSNALSSKEALAETPRIYVACLAAYNNGKLHGEWIDADQSAEEIQEEINEMLKASPEPAAEEWAIMDYDMEGLDLGENPDLNDLVEKAELLAEHGEAYAAFYNNNCGDDFEEAYCGRYDSMKEYAEELADSMGDETKAAYFDYGGIEGFTHELEHGGDYWTASASPYGVHVFQNI